MAEIELSGINKVYPDGTHAVHDVDLSIGDGEFLIMVGPSGCAKSTILRMIAGLEHPTTGNLVIGGQRMNDVAPKDRDIAMIFQSYALYPHMTVFENMAFGLRLRKMPEQEITQRIHTAARTLGIEALLERKPKAMSGGQRQRVAMGRAIVREPRAFLMDEPLSNLDAKLRVQVRTQIAKLHARLGITTVYVTHDQVEAMTLGQRICVLRKGIVQQVDTPYQVYTNPSNVFVAGFIGSPSMNFINGQVVVHEGQMYVRVGDQHHLPLPGSVTGRLTTGTDINGASVIVGIRPEHLHEATEHDNAVLPADVDLVETMGSEAFAYFSMDVAQPDLSSIADAQSNGPESFVAKLPATLRARRGEQMHLALEMEHVHLFDPHTLVTLLAPLDQQSAQQLRSERQELEGNRPAPRQPAPTAATASATPYGVESAPVSYAPPGDGAGQIAAAAMVPAPEVAAYRHIASAHASEQAAPAGHDFPRPRFLASKGAEAAAAVHAANPGFRSPRPIPQPMTAGSTPVPQAATAASYDPAADLPTREHVVTAPASPAPAVSGSTPRPASLLASQGTGSLLPPVDMDAFDAIGAPAKPVATGSGSGTQKRANSKRDEPRVFRNRPLFG